MNSKITVSTQDFLGQWTSETFSSKQLAFEFIAAGNGCQRCEIEGVEFAGNIPTYDELMDWMNAPKPGKVNTKRVSQNVTDDQNMYVWNQNVLCVANYVDSQYSEKRNDVTGEFEPDYIPEHYTISFHDGLMPAYQTDEYSTIEALAAAMKRITDLRTWRVGSENA